jgi:hypothetical protein
MQQSHLRIEELPDVPEIWLDFLHSRLSELPVPAAIDDLVVKAKTVCRRPPKAEMLIRALADGGTKSPGFSS